MTERKTERERQRERDKKRETNFYDSDFIHVDILPFITLGEGRGRGYYISFDKRTNLLIL